MIPDKDRIRGSLIAGAIGDALGYPVEFIYDYRTIQKKYGEKGITRYDTRHWWKDEREQDGKAWVSDDTQMTLFTACGLLNAQADIAKTTLDPDTIRKHMICSAYLINDSIACLLNGLKHTEVEVLRTASWVIDDAGGIKGVLHHEMNT